MSAFNDQGFEVPPLGKKQIRSSAESLRKALGVNANPYFKPVEVIEVVLDQEMEILSFSTDSKSEMPHAEGHTAFGGKEIILREDVYERALAGTPRDRFTAAHELGHWALHSSIEPRMARSKSPTTPAYKCSEWQANQFAAEILMPFEFFLATDSVQLVMKRHGTSYQAAAKRLKEYFKNDWV